MAETFEIHLAFTAKVVKRWATVMAIDCLLVG